MWRDIIRKVRALTLGLALAVTGLAMVGCDSLSSESGDGQGRVRVLLTDSPFPYDLVAEARVTITSVELIRLDGDAAGRVVVISDEDQSFNLLDLRNGVTAEIGELNIEPGVYSHASLAVSDASILMNDGTEYDLKVPSSRIKVLLPNFEVLADGESEVTLDFDVEHSFVVRGNIHSPGFKGFIFKPVIRPINISIGDEDRDLDLDFDDDLKIEGPISAVTASSLTIGDLEIRITSETLFDGLSGIAALIVGNAVRVEYELDDDGNAVATRIRPAASDDVFEIEGIVMAATESTVVVNGVTFLLTGDTVYDGEIGGPAGLTVGTRIEIRYRIGAGGALEATHIEKE